MRDYRQLERHFTRLLGIERRPVAVAYRPTPPEGIPTFEGSQPSGCSFWRLAAEGRTFSTAPSDHYNCPIGSYTHNVPLPPDREGELGQTLGLMTELDYVRMEEVPGLFRLPETPGAIVYAPLGETPVDPDVILFAAPASRLMLLEEAAVRAGALSDLPLMPRPTCMALPAALRHGAVASGGCIGNRVYTGIGEGELYMVIPGRDLERLAAELATIVEANARLAEYHQTRRAALEK